KSGHRPTPSFKLTRRNALARRRPTGHTGTGFEPRGLSPRPLSAGLVMDTVADCQELLRQAGWAVNESHNDSGGSVEWLVMGANGANVIEARAASQTAA